MGKKIKEKIEESKIYKAFRRITSLGLAGALAAFFPNEIVAWLSAGAGFLYGKGIISLAAMTGIVTFLGSAAGLVVQKIVLCGLTYLFSNVILKQGKRLCSFVKRKVKGVFSKKPTKIETKKTESLVKTVQKEEKQDFSRTNNNTPSTPTKSKVKTLGLHPSMRK